MENLVTLSTASTPVGSPSLIDSLARRYSDLKKERARLDKSIAELESALVDCIGHKEEGAFSVDSENFKVTTTGKVYRKVDESGLTKLRKVISRTIFNKVFRTKHEINLKELRHFENNDPEIFAEIAKVVTSKPGKTAIKVEELS